MSKSQKSRREFLSAVAVAPAIAAVVPVVAASPVAASIISPTAAVVPVWATLATFTDGSTLPDEFYPSRPQVYHGIRFHHGKKPKIQQMEARFTGRTFRLANIDWNQYEGEIDHHICRQDDPAGFHPTAKDIAEHRADTIAKLGIDGETFDAEVKRARAMNKKRRGGQWFRAGRQPGHALDLPDTVSLESEHYMLPSDTKGDRESAMVEVARYNRTILDEEYANDSDYTHALWYWGVCFEVSEPFDAAVLMTVEGCGDLGIEKRHEYRAVRLVRPTAEEIARFGGPIGGAKVATA